MERGTKLVQGPATANKGQNWDSNQTWHFLGGLGVFGQGHLDGFMLIIR